MITEAFMSMLFYIGGVFLRMFPSLDFNVDLSAFSAVGDILNAVTYLLPWDTTVAIAQLIVSICMIRFVIALIRAIRGFVPFMSS